MCAKLNSNATCIPRRARYTWSVCTDGVDLTFYFRRDEGELNIKTNRIALEIETTSRVISSGFFFEYWYTHININVFYADYIFFPRRTRVIYRNNINGSCFFFFPFRSNIYTTHGERVYNGSRKYIYIYMLLK